MKEYSFFTPQGAPEGAPDPGSVPLGSSATPGAQGLFLGPKRGLPVQHFYLVGQPTSESEKEALRLEQEKYGDIVVLPHVVDNYKNLTLKVVEGMKLIYRHFSFDYLYKTDDDTYIRLLVLKRRIEKLKADYGRGMEARVFAGYLLQGMPVLKLEGHPNSDFGYQDGDKYLPYMSGSGYLLSSDLVQLVVDAPVPCRQLVNEDVSIGFCLGPHKVNRVDDAKYLHILPENDLCDKGTEHFWYMLHYVRSENVFQKCASVFVDSGFDKANFNKFFT